MMLQWRKTNFVCEDCGKKFDRKYNLSRHENRVHMKEIPKVFKIPSRTMNEFLCNKCDRWFSNASNLRRHKRNSHIHKELQVFICDVCEKSCRNRTEFLEHWKNNHTVKVFSLQRCPTCNTDVKSKEILDHFVQVHNMEIQIQEYSFPNENTFLEWKKKIERDSYSRYVVFYKSKKRTITKYICHRSGYYQSHSKGIRNIKTQGSKKINAFCPASIRVEKSGAELLVKFITTHVHFGSDKENEIRHLSISPKKKENIAGKLTDKIPKTFIIENIPKSYEGINLKRKDLINIEEIANVRMEENSISNYAAVLDPYVEDVFISNGLPSVYEEESAEIKTISSKFKLQQETVTKKSLNRCYLRITRSIKTDAGRVLLMKCLEEAEKKIGIFERTTSYY